MSNDAADATITKREKPFEYMNRTVHSPYLLDYARSGRSKCGKCRKEILGLTLRLGTLYKPRNKGVRCTWFHPRCFNFPKTLKTMQDFSALQTIEDNDLAIVEPLLAESIVEREKKRKQRELELKEADGEGDGEEEGQKQKKKRRTVDRKKKKD